MKGTDMQFPLFCPKLSGAEVDKECAFSPGVWTEDEGCGTSDFISGQAAPKTPIRRRKSRMRLSVLVWMDLGQSYLCIWSPSDWNEVSVSWGQGPLLSVQVPGVLPSAQSIANERMDEREGIFFLTSHFTECLQLHFLLIPYQTFT